MDEYLFFQNHKKILGKQNDQFLDSASQKKEETKKTKAKFQSIMQKLDDQYEEAAASSPLRNTRGSMSLLNSPSKFKEEVKEQKKEFSSESMKFGLDNISQKYKEQYMNAGYPPKICSLFVEKLNTKNRLKTHILDVGCGKGSVGQALKQMGFFRLSGLDCSKSLLSISKDKNCYENLDQCAFGMDYTVVPEKLINKFDFVISASMINNDGFDIEVFKNLLSCLKLGGFVIFATKLNFAGDDQYDLEIKELSEQNYWTYTAQHSFFRYDKMVDGSGKFSNKMVKILAYQKTDHDAWQAEQDLKKKVEEEVKAQLEAAEAQKKKERDAKYAKEGKKKDTKKKK